MKKENKIYNGLRWDMEKDTSGKFKPFNFDYEKYHIDFFPFGAILNFKIENGKINGCFSYKFNLEERSKHILLFKKAFDNIARLIDLPNVNLYIDVIDFERGQVNIIYSVEASDNVYDDVYEFIRLLIIIYSIDDYEYFIEQIF
jgi:hypothetical protein